jgi:DNA-binding MarR family transcriptional regulator
MEEPKRPMPKNSTETSLGYTIGKTNYYLKTLINKLLKEEKCGITNEQWLVLKVIDATPEMTQTEIAEKSQKDKTNITRIIDLLEKNGYVDRRRDERDRRMYRICATEGGKNVLSSVKPITQKTEEICTQSISPSKVKEIIMSLDAVCDSIKRAL